MTVVTTNLTRNCRFYVISTIFLSLLLALWSPFTLAKTVDLKVLVISTGNATEDLGLDLIDDVLDEMGVPYDVLDSRREDLEANMLSEEEHGFYNGIIVTNSELFIGPGLVGFTPEEWQILHDYEQSFSVRESILSGFPGAVSGLVYVGAGSSFNGTWLEPAGENELFEYINTGNNLPVTDWSFVFSGSAGGPQVQPLLVDNGDTSRSLVAKLNYDNGREVLYSSITNAWYLIHSQVLAYEFVNFATKGVFIGGRHVYFAAHVDDYFTSDDLWNPETNVTDEDRTFRLSGDELVNALAKQTEFRNQHATLNNLVLDMAFNGKGAVLPQAPPPDAHLISASDTFIEEDDPWENNGNADEAKIKHVSGSDRDERTLLQFDIPTESPAIAQTATLNIWTQTTVSDSGSSSRDSEEEEERSSWWSWRERDSDSSSIENSSALSAQVCRVTSHWREGSGRDYRNATWITRISTTRWATKGGDYDASSCISFDTASNAMVSIDITSIANVWLSGQAPNYGLIIMATSDGRATIQTREASNESQRPSLDIAFAAQTTDSLTAATMQYKDQLRFINHTYSHLNMDVSAGTTYEDAYAEIDQNRMVWQQLGLPEYDENLSVLVSGNHSGLKDDNNTEQDPADDIQYPDGRNTEFLRAAEDLGVRYLASDSSQINQGIEQYVPSPNESILLAPRRPSALFYNVTTPDEWTDEYNYIFYERFINDGQDPCTIPGAICAPRSFEEILTAEADWNLRLLLSYRPWPHFFHQSNLHNYDGQGSTLLFNWMEAIVSRYEQVFTLPLKNLPYYAMGELVEDRIKARNTNITGTWDLTNNTVTVIADEPVNALVTGVSGGEVYGGQSIQTLPIGPDPQVFNVDRMAGQEEEEDD